MDNKKIFLSYNFLDKDIIAQFYSILSHYTDLDVYFFDEVLHTDEWEKEIKDAIRTSKYFLLFMGSHLGKTQLEEIAIFKYLKQDEDIKCIKIELSNFNRNEFQNLNLGDLGTIVIKKNANGITDIYSGIKVLSKKYLNININFGDDLPLNPHLFDYEKTIIDFYMRKEKLCGKKIGNITEVDENKIDDLMNGLILSQGEISKRLKLTHSSNAEYLNIFISSC